MQLSSQNESMADFDDKNPILGLNNFNVDIILITNSETQHISIYASDS